MAGDVFLNYRRDDTAGYAGRLYDRLSSRFPNRVFMDVGGITPGSDFVAAIESAVSRCAALIALIGKQWHSDRLRDPSDFVRVEIASALKRDIRVIPVLVGGASLPAAHDLPEDVAPLLRRQAIVISDSDWESGCENLVRALEGVLGRTKSRFTRQRQFAAGLLAVCLASGSYYLFRYRFRPEQGPDVPAQTVLTNAATRNAVAQRDALDAITDALNNNVTKKIQDSNQSPATADMLPVFEGHVLDKTSRLPVAGAEIVTVQVGADRRTASSLTDVTTASGSFSFRAPGGERFDLIATRDGYQEARATINGPTHDIVVLLQHK